jgi:hypothetical protein
MANNVERSLGWGSAAAGTALWRRRGGVPNIVAGLMDVLRAQRREMRQQGFTHQAFGSAWTRQQLR